MRDPVLGEIAYVAPVALGDMAVERAARSQERGEQLLAEIVRPAGRDDTQHGGVENVDAGIDRVAEDLAPGRLLEKANDPSVLVRDDDAVGERHLHAREHHGRFGGPSRWKARGREVEVGEDVAGDHEYWLVRSPAAKLTAPAVPRSAAGVA